MKKVILLILDGFGIRASENGNAIKMSNLSNLSNIFNDYSVSELECSGEEVGLNNGISGNSEVGHTTIGCGRIIKQPLVVINESIKEKKFFENDTLLDVMDHVCENNSSLHLIGTISDSNVESSMEHLYACLALAKIRKVKNVYLHFITDGVYTSSSAKNLISDFMEKTSKLGIGVIGTLCGRYFAMDNDGNYDRIKKYYDLLVHNLGNVFTDYERCLELHHKNGITDEFVNPSVICKGSTIKDNDGILFFNYRNENLEELITSFTDESFTMFPVKKLKNIKIVSLYGTSENVSNAYTNETISNTFGKYLIELGFKQTRIAEASRYKNVTYYFDGLEDLSDSNMDKILVPSPNVARYDMKPEMNISQVTTAVIDAIEEDNDFILVNLCNPDVVGHTGNIPATIKALEVSDVCIGEILNAAQENFYDLIITSSHGNVECVKAENGNEYLENTTNRVPFVICNKNIKLKSTGTLKDVIPTIIDVYEVSKPKDMTGESLIIH